MTYIENVFLCLALPLLLTLPFTKTDTRRFTLFLTLGMGVCLLSAYVSSFFMTHYAMDSAAATLQITPICEEAMKLLPLLFYFLIFEPRPRALPAAAIALAAGFATFENACYLTEHGGDDFTVLLIRGFSAGALHILCGIFCGFGISYVFPRRWLALTGTVGIFGFCTGFHSIYNLLISAEGTWRIIGYLFPSLLIALLFAAKKLLSHLRRAFPRTASPSP